MSESILALFIDDTTILIANDKSHQFKVRILYNNGREVYQLIRCNDTFLRQHTCVYKTEQLAQRFSPVQV